MSDQNDLESPEIEKDLLNEEVQSEDLEKLEDPLPQEAEEEQTGFEAPKIVSKPQEEKKPPPSRSPKKDTSPYKRLVAISFHPAGKLYDFDSKKIELAVGNQVILETDDGLGFATVAVAPREEYVGDLDRALKKIIRKTNYDDMRQHEKNKERELRANEICRKKIQKFNLPMKLVQVEYLHSGSKAIFYFTSETRVDFRKLVRELAQEFHTRIEMRQIGPRDETKIMGSIGVCGRELCCTTWLREFDPISIKMAKEQELSLNPSKLAGQCGRLKCCLSYEYETYIAAKKGFPKIGKKVCWKDGSPCGKVSGHNIFRGTLRVSLDDGSEKEVPTEDVQIAHPPQAG